MSDLAPNPSAATDRLPAVELEALQLRLRVEELEMDLEEARRRVATTLAELSRVRGPLLGRALARLADAAADRRDAALAAALAAARAPGFVRIPLVGMASEAEGRAPQWADELSVGGTVLPGVQADAPSRLTYRVMGGRSSRFRTFAGIRDGLAGGNRGGTRFVVSVIDVNGAELLRAERVLDPRRRPKDRAWARVELDLGSLTATEHQLVLAAELPDGADAAYSWATWGDPVLLAPASASERASGGHRAGSSGETPVISFLVPVHDPAATMLRATIDSVFAQSSPRWQLCLSDDGSRSPEVRAILDEAAARDARVVLTRNASSRGISEATNAALALASGDYVAPLDHDDTLAPDAVATVGGRLAGDQSIDVLYTDNDKEIPGGRRFAAALKPDWSPELMRACMYTLHLGVYRRALVEQVGGFRPAFDGAQDHDMVLRLADAGARVAHEPSVLHHWGVHMASTAQGSGAKPEAFSRGVAAVQEHLERTGIAAKAVRLPIPGRYRVVHDADPRLAADLILPLSRDLPDGAAQVLAALACDPRGTVRVTVVSPTTLDVPEGVTVVHAQGGGWGHLAAAGLVATSSPVVVLFEDVCIPETPDWLDELAGLVSEPGIGAAGALVVDSDGRTVHAGVALPQGVPLPVHPGADPAADEPAPELTMVTNRSAAAGVVAFDRAALVRAGGVARLDRLALAATTLAVSDGGSRIVVSPHARLRLVGQARGATIDTREIAVIAGMRGDRADPYYHPELWADRAAHVVPVALRRRALRGESV